MTVSSTASEDGVRRCDNSTSHAATWKSSSSTSATNSTTSLENVRDWKRISRHDNTFLTFSCKRRAARIAASNRQGVHRSPPSQEGSSPEVGSRQSSFQSVSQSQQHLEYQGSSLDSGIGVDDEHFIHFSQQDLEGLKRHGLLLDRERHNLHAFAQKVTGHHVILGSGECLCKEASFVEVAFYEVMAQLTTPTDLQPHYCQQGPQCIAALPSRAHRDEVKALAAFLPLYYGTYYICLEDLVWLVDPADIMQEAEPESVIPQPLARSGLFPLEPSLGVQNDPPQSPSDTGSIGCPSTAVTAEGNGQPMLVVGNSTNISPLTEEGEEQQTPVVFDKKETDDGKMSVFIDTEEAAGMRARVKKLLKKRQLMHSFGRSPLRNTEADNNLRNNSLLDEGRTGPAAVGTTASVENAALYPAMPGEQTPSDISNASFGSGEGSRLVMPFTVIRDITADMKIPCVVDIKMGIRGHGMNATTKKVVSKSRKALMSTSCVLGFRLGGMKAWDAAESKFVRMNKLEGRKLTVDSVVQPFVNFFGSDLRRVQLFQERLELLKEVFSKQNYYRFFTSSLLVAYDAAVDGGPVTVKMVDFGHTYPLHALAREEIGAARPAVPQTLRAGFDTEYVIGLRSLIAVCDSILTGRPFVAPPPSVTLPPPTPPSRTQSPTTTSIEGGTGEARVVEAGDSSSLAVLKLSGEFNFADPSDEDVVKLLAKTSGDLLPVHAAIASRELTQCRGRGSDIVVHDPVQS